MPRGVPARVENAPADCARVCWSAAFFCYNAMLTSLVGNNNERRCCCGAGTGARAPAPAAAAGPAPSPVSRQRSSHPARQRGRHWAYMSTARERHRAQGRTRPLLKMLLCLSTPNWRRSVDACGLGTMRELHRTAWTANWAGEPNGLLVIINASCSTAWSLQRFTRLKPAARNFESPCCVPHSVGWDKRH